MKKKILFVDDDRSIQEDIADLLPADKVEVLSAFTIAEAEKLFAENDDIALIVLDGCVDGDKFDTLPLLQKMRETFTGPILAASNAPPLNDLLMEGGCSDFADGKSKVPSKIIEILGL